MDVSQGEVGSPPGKEGWLVLPNDREGVFGCVFIEGMDVNESCEGCEEHEGWERHKCVQCTHR